MADLPNHDSLFRAMINSNSAVMLVITPGSGAIVYANKAAEAFYGYPEGVLTCMNISEINQHSPEEIKQEIDQAIEARKNRFIFPHKLANGDVRTVEVHSSKIMFESMEYLYSVVHDVTELKQTQELIKHERDLYRDLIDSQPIGIYRVRILPLATWKNEAWLSSKNAPYVIEVLNDRFCEILGVSKETCLNNPGILNDLVHPEDKTDFAKGNEEANASLNKFYWEGRLIIDGNIRWVRFESLPRVLTSEEVIWTGSLQDITARKHAEKRLQKTELKLRLTVENSTNLFYLHTADHVLTYVSPQSREFFDCKPEEAMIRWTDFLTDNPVNQEGLLMTQRAIDTGKRQPLYQIECIGKRGRKIWAEVNEAPIIENGRTVAISGTLTDITKRKQAEIENQLLTENIKLKNAELERFVYTASHDLKTPLTTISGFAEILKERFDETCDKDVVSYLNHIYSAAIKMNQLLNDLLIYSRTGHLQLNNETVCLNELAQEVMSEVEWLLAEGQVRCEVSKNLPPVSGDRSQLRQVIQNLVENAIKYMGEQPEPYIEIGTATTDEGFAYYVRDNGMGIAPQYHNRVFNLFEQLSNDKKGTGVGLALVKQIVERHGGKVWIESSGEPGKGTTFWFTLKWVEKE